MEAVLHDHQDADRGIQLSNSTVLTHTDHDHLDDDHHQNSSNNKKWRLLLLNTLLLITGDIAGPLVQRLYFVKGGKRIWFSSWLETGGFPVILVPLLFSYANRRNRNSNTIKSSTASKRLIEITPKLTLASIGVGVLYGLDDYMYSAGLSCLPVSTSSLLVSTHLAFTAVFAFLMVKQKFTAYSVNAVVVLTIGSAVLGLHGNKDIVNQSSSSSSSSSISDHKMHRRIEESGTRMYYYGFFMILGASLLFGFILPLVELVYRSACKTSSCRISYTLVLEIQLVVSITATLFCSFGMLLTGDFQAIPAEAREFELGESKYYMVVVVIALVWQFHFIGTAGVILYSSSLFNGILAAFDLPLTQLMAVIFFKESFGGEKGVSLALAMWGFISYLYGERKVLNQGKKKTVTNQGSDLQTLPNV